MIYLKQFVFPEADQEFDFFLRQKRTCYDSFYPFQILSRHSFRQIDFEPVTILYGGNGTGKTTALNVIAEKITENALFLLDEPENSLAPGKQEELVKFIEDSARFYGCQFVISTHSPFVLAIRGAKIYDLDSDPVDVKRWTQLDNVRIYYDFFKRHESEFER